MLDDATVDADFRALAEEEIEELTARQETLIEEMQNTLVMADDMHIDAIIVEIRAGTGGEEAALFAKDLYGMYTRYADARRWKTEQLDFSASEMGGFREVIFSIKGEGVWAELGYEGGGHRVQRVPETESQGRIHTSAATVAVAARAGRGRYRDRTGRCDRARLPLKRPRRPERQQGQQRHQTRTHSHRYHGEHAGRKKPA